MDVGPGDGSVALASQREAPRIVHVSIQCRFRRELNELDLRRRILRIAGSDAPSLEHPPAVVRHQPQDKVLIAT
jgi:hypothetical protein